MADRPAHGGYPGEPMVRDADLRAAANIDFNDELGRRIREAVEDDVEGQFIMGGGDNAFVVLITPSVPRDTILVVYGDDGMPYKITVQPNEE